MEVIQSYSPVSKCSSDFVGQCFNDNSDVLNDDDDDEKDNSDSAFWDQLSNLLAKNESECDYTNDDDQNRLINKRCRLDIETKKNIVLQYYQFCNDGQDESALDEDHSTTKTLGNNTSLRAFVKHNNSKPKNLWLEHSNLSKWIRAEKRGEYQPWELNINAQTTRKITSPQKILKHIDTKLKLRDKFHGVFNKIVRSPSVPGEYGVVARKFTPAGTFLGFYKGTVISGIANDTRNHDYTFGIGRNKFIDASDYYSCFARYYNCSLKSVDQNVCVEILSDWTNPQKAVCFIANRDVKMGDEFLISYGPEYWEATAANIPACSPFRRVCNTLSGKTCGLESIEPLFSIDAPFLAAEFGDDKSVSSEDEDSDYCE
jgi:hypothetical protein